jgi:hypothetical protein
MKKMTIVITVLIVIALIGTLYIDRLGLATYMTKPALKISVTTAQNETLGLQVTNMTFEQTTLPIYYQSVDSPVRFPDIDIQGQNGTIASEPVTYWQSFVRTSTDASYNFTLTFMPPYVPQKDDLLILSVRMNDWRGTQQYKTTAFYVWK